MKLWDVPRHSKIKLDLGNKEEILNFDHVDGMYSLCFDSRGRPVHIAAWTEVEVVNDTGSESKSESKSDP